MMDVKTYCTSESITDNVWCHPFGCSSIGFLESDIVQNIRHRARGHTFVVLGEKCSFRPTFELCCNNVSILLQKTKKKYWLPLLINIFLFYRCMSVPQSTTNIDYIILNFDISGYDNQNVYIDRYVKVCCCVVF